MNKNLLIDAMIGRGLAYEFAVEMVKRGLARWTGNQHNESWAWNRHELEKLDVQELQSLYKRSAE